MLARKSSIIYKITAIITALLLFIFAIYYGFLNLQIKSFLIREGLTSLTLETEIMQTNIEKILDKYETIIEQGKNNKNFIQISSEIKNSKEKKQHPLYEDVITELKEISNLDKNISHAYLAISKANDILADTSEFQVYEGYNLLKRNWYVETIENDRLTITSPYIDLITNKETISITTPIKVNNEIIAVLGIDILLEQVYEMMDELSSLSNSELGVIYSDGKILFSQNQNLKQNEKIYIQDLLCNEEVDKILSKSSGLIKCNTEQEKKYISYYPIKDTNLIVYTSISEAEVIKPINYFVSINLLILIGLIIFIITTSIVLENTFSKPIIEICKEVDKYNKKEKLIIPDKYKKRKDEIGILSNGITYMMDNISKNINKLEDKNKELINKQEKIIYLSYHDQLTGLYNRRYFQETITKLDKKEFYPISLAMIDVNGLKLINDAFGHQTGDKLLKKVADILIETCRDEDIVSRIGGDEFVIIFTKTDSAKVKELVKRIYKASEDIKINEISISISIGWETKYLQEQDIMEIFNRAEEYMYRKKLAESQSMRNETIKIILKTLHETNERESLHSENVSIISRKIGEALGLDGELLREIEIAGALHDIGKIAINHNIINKAGTLTESEYETVKKHPEAGYHILKSVEAYSIISEYVLNHHEKWDGTGYPRGLKGEEIPIISRIISVADAYEAMISNRPYRKALSKEEAKEELIRCSGTQFDPNIVNVFINM